MYKYIHINFSIYIYLYIFTSRSLNVVYQPAATIHDWRSRRKLPTALGAKDKEIKY